MRQMTDQAFDKIENAIALLHVPIGNGRPIPLEKKCNWAEKEFSKIAHGEESIEENFTATYWG